MSYVVKAHIECKIPVGMVIKTLLGRHSPVMSFILSIDVQLNHTPLYSSLNHINIHGW